MSDSAGGSRSPLGRASGFRMDTMVDTGVGTASMLLGGDLDAIDTPLIETSITQMIDRGLNISVRLDAVTMFGSAASRTIENIIDWGDNAEATVEISGVTPLVARTLDALGVVHPSIIRDAEGSALLNSAVFDSVISRGVLRGRESVCVTTADVDRPRILFVNEAFTDLTGYHADEVLGLNPRLLQGNLTDRAVIDELKLAVRERREFNGEAVNYRKDGTPFWMNWKISDVRVGARSFLLALQRDGTDVRQLARLQSARTRIERVARLASDQPKDRLVLEALATSAELVIEAPSAVASTAITSPDGSVLVANDIGSLIDESTFASQQAEQHLDADDASVHLPFDLGDGRTAHLAISNFHPDWLRLCDTAHLETLCDVARLALTSGRVA